MWVTFTYVRKETRFINKLFKDTNITVAFTTNSKIGKSHSMEHKYNKSRVYLLTCPDCKMTYIGQTDNHSISDSKKKKMRDFK